MNYYNEFDPNAAEWLRQLIAMKAIPEGEVDERSITEIDATELRGYVQCHFFAGIGGWPLALARAGVPADRPLWTGSCPCQAFSCAGKGEGVKDHRDLWPVFAGLIRECRPVRVLGEQVEAAVGHGWLDRLSADLEAEGYAVGAVVLGAHSAGADHQRQRLYWVADAKRDAGRADEQGWRPQGRAADCRDSQAAAVADAASMLGAQHEREQGQGLRRGPWTADAAERGGDHAGSVADAERGRREQRDTGERVIQQSDQNGACIPVADAESIGRKQQQVQEPARIQPEETGQGECVLATCGRGTGEPCCDFGGVVYPIGERGRCGQPRREDADHAGQSSQARNFWSAAVPIPCRDGTFRRAEPGIFPLVDGLPRGVVPSCDPCAPGYANETAEARVMRLKGYGNAINVETARMFIEAVEQERGR